MTTERWTAWGDQQPTLSPAAVSMLRSELGPLTPSTPAALTDARVAPSRLPSTVRAHLQSALGADAVRDDVETRARHAGGQSYADLVHRRAGDAAAAPDAVVLPRSADDV